MTQRVYVIGASVRAAAQSLARAGFTPLAADQFNDLDLQLTCAASRIADYPQGFLTAIPRDADAFVYTGGLENHPEIIDAIANRLPLWGTAGETLRAIRNVTLLEHNLRTTGFRMPPMRHALPMGDHAGWLRKSQSSAGGLRVSRATENQTALAHDEYFQRRIEGTCYGATFVGAAESAWLIGVAEQLPACSWTHAPEFHYCGSIGPIELLPALREEIVCLGNHLARAFDLRGWFGIDFIVDPDESLWVLEVNPRYTASIELFERAFGIATAAAHRGACMHNVILDLPRLESTSVVGKAVLYGPPGCGGKNVDSQALQSRSQAISDLADIPAENQAIYAAQPILSLFATAQTFTTAQTVGEVRLILEQKAGDMYRSWDLA